MGNKTKGYLLGAIAAATYGMNPLFALPLYADGLSPDSVLFFRYILGSVILGFMVWYKGFSFKITFKETVTLLFLGLLVAMSSLALFTSYTYMDAGIASTLLFVYPVMVAIIMAVFYKERISLILTLGIALSLLGIFLLYNNGNGATLSTKGTLIVMVSALTYALYIVGVNKFGLSNMPTVKVSFWVLVFGFLLFAFRVLFYTDLQIPTKQHSYLWISVFALALLPTAISLLCTTSAVKYVGSTITAILGSLEPATAVFIGIIIFDEQLTLRDFIGLSLIITSVTIVVATNRISGYIIRLRKMFPSIKKHKQCGNIKG